MWFFYCSGQKGVLLLRYFQSLMYNAPHHSRQLVSFSRSRRDPKKSFYLSLIPHFSGPVHGKAIFSLALGPPLVFTLLTCKLVNSDMCVNFLLHILIYKNFLSEWAFNVNLLCLLFWWSTQAAQVPKGMLWWMIRYLNPVHYGTTFLFSIHYFNWFFNWFSMAVALQFPCNAVIYWKKPIKETVIFSFPACSFL